MKTYTIGQRTVIALLLADKHRKAGSFESDGKLIEYGDAYQLVALPVGEQKYIRKYTVDPFKEAEISKELSNANYGALVKMDVNSATQVVGVEIVSDYLADHDIDGM